MPAPSHRATRSLVLRSLGAVCVIAFLSLWVQLDALIGARGILPLREHLGAVAARAADPLWAAPTLFWWAPHDGALHAACALGVGLGGLLALGWRVEGPVLAALWALYLSLSHAGQVFLGFQWDTLLTETLFVSLAVARWWPGAPDEPPRLGVLALRLLLFKLMFGSGLAKLASGDPTWWDGSALAYHYWTQPLPNPLSWWFDRAPAAWHALETWATLGIELLLPFAIAFGRPGRAIAAGGFALVLALLMISGNYGFFQLLSLVLVLSLLDDALLAKLTAGRLGIRSGAAPLARPRTGWREVPIGLLVALWVGASVPTQLARTGGGDAVPEALVPALVALAPFRTVNAYGLFARMTTTRPEVRIEGSPDGVQWAPYVTRYAPGPPDRRPPQVAPHMPRLDWQLWFAALSTCQRTPWLPRLMDRLLEREPAVLALFAEEPFPGRVRYVRAVRAHVEPSAGPGWWVEVDPPRPFCPTQERSR